MFALQEKLIDTYDYRDEAGQVLYQVLRFEPKAFRQRAKDGVQVLTAGDGQRIVDARERLRVRNVAVGAFIKF